MIKSRERRAILQSLRAGVVPRVGLRHIQVGRKDEVAAVLTDLEEIRNDSAAVRFVIGRFGSGKSFFLNLMRIIALEKKFVVVQADITPDRRLHASAGQAQGLYAELMRNAATRSKPEGSALPGIVERWVADVDYAVRSQGGTDSEVAREIHKRLKPLQDYVNGYDFAAVISKYYEGFQTHNDVLMESALRWLRGEFNTKTEARQALDVRSIIGDKEVYDYLKLFAAFVRMAGFSGLLVSLDEMGVLSHRLNSSQARNANYEMILRIVNDCLQGQVSGLGFIFAGTNEFLEDRRRGLASYEALATRLAENAFSVEGVRDHSGPVIRLNNLSAEDLYVLLRNIRTVQASGDETKHLLPDEALMAFLQHCAETLGAEFYQTPRDAVKSFVGLLSVLEQNSDKHWRDLLRTDDKQDKGALDSSSLANHSENIAVPSGNPADKGKDNDLASFRL